MVVSLCQVSMLMVRGMELLLLLLLLLHTRQDVEHRSR